MDIKPLVDANRHTEAIEFSYHQSPIRFPPIHYRNPRCESRSPSGQTILFGCPLELCTVGEQNKIPPVLEYLLDSVHGWRSIIYASPYEVGQKRIYRTPNSLYSKKEEFWDLANKLEQAWTGVEETDRAILAKLAPLDQDRMFLIMVCPRRYTIQRLSDFVGILYGPSKASMDRP